MSSVRQALTPEALARLSTMALRARAAVEGHYSGRHASAYRGASVEFVDHREYAPGDEPRHIDWRVYGRTDRLFVKQYESETNLDLHLLLDVSRSMDFASGSVSKLRCATFIAAALAYLATNQRDAVGLFLFDHAVRRHLPAMTSPAHLARLFEALDAAEPGEDTRLTPALEEVAGRLGRRAIIVLLSDLLDGPEEVLRSLAYFRHRGHDVIVLQLLDPAELRLDYRGTVAFEDLETAERLSLEVGSVREAYLGELRRFLAAYRHGCRDRSLDYALLDTSIPFDAALAAYLARRSTHLSRR
ncbi:MAG: DUF58 domain-containing protein [Armatimonadetes bacterium]|nr:DUF58 domain-containing protein [Armatimonadota bacterium]